MPKFERTGVENISGSPINEIGRLIRITREIRDRKSGTIAKPIPKELQDKLNQAKETVERIRAEELKKPTAFKNASPEEIQKFNKDENEFDTKIAAWENRVQALVNEGVLTDVDDVNGLYDAELSELGLPPQPKPPTNPTYERPMSGELKQAWEKFYAAQTEVHEWTETEFINSLSPEDKKLYENSKKRLNELKDQL